MPTSGKTHTKPGSSGSDLSKNESRDQNLYNLIFDAVLAQRLLPGTKLAEEELAEIFKVSRATVRRALLRLSHDRIVEIIPNRGASVVCPSIKQAREIILAREVIEGAIVREVVARAGKAQIEALREVVNQEKQNFESENRASGIRLSGEFHLRLAALSENTTLIKFIKELIPQTSLIIAQYEKPGHATCSDREHFELIDVISAGDAEQAVRLMKLHLKHIENKLDLEEHSPQTDLRQVFSDLLGQSAGLNH